MTSHIRFSAPLLAALSLSALAHVPAVAQEGAGDATPQEDEEEEIVIAGQRERGSVVGDIKPEQQLRAADIRALGISTVSDLLTELGPQLQSASGKPPVTLLEGHRIASFREIATLPAEAIARVDILPEEVGLRYGYGADQKVMNIVLRQRFRAFTAEAGARVPTAGQGLTQDFELGHLSIRRGQRLNLNAEYTHSGDILQSDRGITGDEAAARTLSPERETVTVNASYARPLTERTQATLTGEVSNTRTASLVGPALPSTILVPGGAPYANSAADVAVPLLPGNVGPLDRSASTQNGQIGLTLNAMRSTGQWTLTASYARQDSRGLTDRPFDLAAYRAAIARGDAAANPALPIAPLYLTTPADETQSRQDSANIDFVYNRSLFRLPAGDVQATAKLSGAMMRLESSQERNSLVTNRRIGRESGSASVTLSLPILAQTSAIGRLSANANLGVDEYSDAGTLRSFGFGLNWTPRRGINLSASYRDDESAPTPSQLGDPTTITQAVPVFDYVRGESALVTTISGGNPLLADARERNFRLGLNMSLLQEPNLTLSVDYSHRSTSGGIIGFPGVTVDTQAAFPDRFQRDVGGRLIQVDLRPINIGEQSRDSLRWGINFSKRLKTPQSQIDAMRAAFQRRFPNGVPGRPAGPGAGQERTGGQGEAPPPVGQPAGDALQTPAPGEGRVQFGPGGSGGGGRGFGGGGRGFGGGGPGGGGGRINFAVYHEWMLGNTTQLAASLPKLDLLDGDSLGSGAGPSRHRIEVQAGVSQSGYGLRLTGDWKSATRIAGAVGSPASQLHFSDFGTLNLRLFANLTQMPKLVESMPLLRGVRVQLGVDNLFNARQQITDGTGRVLTYDPAFIEPIGRTVRLSIRKLFF